jgi:putative pyruvate formate lyase activating enzyme
VDRSFGEPGICGTDEGIYVANANLHFGEEPVLVRRGGSGTNFFSSRKLRYVFCQNYDISMCTHRRGAGRQLSSDDFS